MRNEEREEPKEGESLLSVLCLVQGFAATQRGAGHRRGLDVVFGLAAAAMPAAVLVFADTLVILKHKVAAA